MGVGGCDWGPGVDGRAFYLSLHPRRLKQRGRSLPLGRPPTTFPFQHRSTSNPNPGRRHRPLPRHSHHCKFSPPFLHATHGLSRFFCVACLFSRVVMWLTAEPRNKGTKPGSECLRGDGPPPTPPASVQVSTKASVMQPRRGLPRHDAPVSKVDTQLATGLMAV